MSDILFNMHANRKCLASNVTLYRRSPNERTKKYH
jgi:hypothetical protein